MKCMRGRRRKRMTRKGRKNRRLKRNRELDKQSFVRRKMQRERRNNKVKDK